MHRAILFALSALVLLAPRALGQELAEVTEVAWRPFQVHCRSLLNGLEKLSAPLSAATVKEARRLLDSDAKSQLQALSSIQKLLDAHCLVGVHINPESRVKVQRGPRKSIVVRDRTTWMLVKVHNEAGITHALSVGSEQAIIAGKKGDGRWIDASIINTAPFTRTLSGNKLEYRVLQLTGHQAGKREATLVFDAGQGTQDLGFRAEVPILFTIESGRE